MVLLVLLSFVVVVEADTLRWDYAYGGTENDWGYSLVQTSDGGYVIAGQTDSFGAGSGDFWLVKTDEFGNMEWNRTYGGTSQDTAYSLVVTSDGGYAIAGHTYSFGAGHADFWLVKTDSSGNLEWNQTYGGTGNEFVHSLVLTSDGGYAILGYTSSFGIGLEDFWLIKTDPYGNMEWNQTYGKTNGFRDWLYVYGCSVVVAFDGGYAIAGYSQSFVGFDDFWLIKTDEFGNEEWNRTYGGTEDDFVYSLIATDDGGYAIIGRTSSFGAGHTDCWLVKTDAYGNMQWNQTYGGTANDYGHSVIKTSDGGYAIAGWTASFGAEGVDFWLVKTDLSGNFEWNQTFEEKGYEIPFSVVETSDGGYAIAGYTGLSITDPLDLWLVKTDEFGVVPEYSSWLLPSILLLATLVIVVYKKKLLKPRSQE
jgi:hypothetical protein